MPKARIAMSKIREIIRLTETAGLSIRKTSRALNVSRPAVDDYLRQARMAGLTWKQVEEMSDEELLARLQQSEERGKDPRYVELVRRLPGLVQELGKKHVTRQLLWEEYRKACPDGYEYSQFCYHLQMYTADTELAMHLDHEPGERLFVDFAGDRPHLTDPVTGKEKPVELFVAVFPASGLIYAEVTGSQKIEEFMTAVRHGMEYAGGAPRIIVPDNLKAAVTTPDKYEPEVNSTFEDFGAYYGCVVIPARPRKPKDKALVEAAVNVVYTRILASLRKRRFATLAEFNDAIAEHLDLLNDREMKKIRMSRRQRFEELEAQHLRPLPPRPYVVRRFVPSATVQANYHVYFSPDRHYYSVPYRYRRKKVRIAYTDREIEIYYNNERIAAHRRVPGEHQYTTTTDHMPSQHRVMGEWNPQRLLNWAEAIGPQTHRLVASVLESRDVPEQAFKSCLGILNLAKSYRAQRLEAASLRACRFHITSYKKVKNILERGLDQEPETAQQQPTLPVHENIRGGEFYTAGANGGRS